MVITAQGSLGRLIVSNDFTGASVFIDVAREWHSANDRRDHDWFSVDSSVHLICQG